MIIIDEMSLRGITLKYSIMFINKRATIYKDCSFMKRFMKGVDRSRIYKKEVKVAVCKFIV